MAGGVALETAMQVEDEMENIEIKNTSRRAFVKRAGQAAVAAPAAALLINAAQAQVAPLVAYVTLDTEIK